MDTKSNILKSLDKYSSSEKSYILQELLKSSHNSYMPIDIDGKVYYIPNEVNKLIDDLVVQIKEISSIKFYPNNNIGDIDIN